MLYPIIDIGSNTVKISVLDSEKIFHQSPVFFKARPIAVKAKIKNNKLPDFAIDELIEVLKEYKNIASMLTDVSPIAFATASLRGLLNADEVIEKAYNETAIKISILSGEKEAIYSFTGAIENRKGRSGISVDMGGGSTEIISFFDNKTKNYTSLPVGCINLTKEFFENGMFKKEECKAYIHSLLTNNAPKSTGKEIFLSGGSAKALLRYRNLILKKSNQTLSISDLDSIYDHFKNSKPNGLIKIKTILKERFELVPAAISMFQSICEYYGKNKMIICKSGVREGFLIKYLENLQK